MSATDSPLGSKAQTEEREAESILEAIEVGSTHDGKESVQSYDLEKNSGSTSKQDPASAALDWTGPDDPGNPQNWSTWKKARHFWPVSSWYRPAGLRLTDRCLGSVPWLRLHDRQFHHLSRKSRHSRIFRCLSNSCNRPSHSLRYWSWIRTHAGESFE